VSIKDRLCRFRKLLTIHTAPPLGSRERRGRLEESAIGRRGGRCGLGSRLVPICSETYDMCCDRLERSAVRTARRAEGKRQ
jgi:hypothetical protein